MRVRESACITPDHHNCFFTNLFFLSIHQGPSGDPGSAGAPGPPGPMVSSLHRLRKHVPLSQPIRSETKPKRGSFVHAYSFQVLIGSLDCLRHFCLAEVIQCFGFVS